jgi:putative drug exporter of the RND superfamily
MTEEAKPGGWWYPSRLPAWYARWVVRLRWLVVAFWVATAGAAMLYLPAIGHSGNDLNQLVSANNPAVQSEIRSFDKFGFPLLSRVAVVQRDPDGLPMGIQTKALMRARAVSEGRTRTSGPSSRRCR